jgi:diketogulonate reductase-like aldo/keto reductase
MERRAFGPAGAIVSVIGQGTWNLELDERTRAIAALRAGLDAGMTHIDTAELYGAGAVEELVGDAIAGRRDEVFLVSKVLPANASLVGAQLACEQSLRRLRTDHLDLYLLHWSGNLPLESTFAAFEQPQQAGKIRWFGVSNFDVAQLEEARSLVGDRVACNQVLYHLRERAIEHEVLPWCERHGVAVVGYSPFGAGHFPSRVTRGGQTLAAIAARHGATARQVALAFLTRRPSLFAIPKAASPAHAIENAGAAELRLDDGDLALIDAAFPAAPLREGESLPML